jgi:hypothetical protein
MKAPTLTAAVRGAARAAVLVLFASIGCSNGTTPTCDGGDEECGSYTTLPPVDATLDTAAPDGGEDSGDAEPEGDSSLVAVDASGVDASDASEASDASDASDAAAPADGSDDGHVSDGGHD